MKFIKEKIIAVLIIASAVSLCACDSSSAGNSETSSSSEIQTQAVTETEQTESAVTDAVTEETAAVTKPEIKFKDVDFDSFPSGKYVKAFREGNYNIKYHIEGKNDSSQTLFFKDDKLHIFLDNLGVQYEIVYMNGMMYNLYKDACYAEPNPVDVSSINIFGFLDYESSGTDDFNGKECRYDEFTDLSGNLTSRIYLDEDGNMIAMEESGSVLVIDSFSDEFSTEGLYEISDDYKQYSYNEFSKLMTEAFTAAYTEKNNESSTDQTEVTTDVSSVTTLPVSESVIEVTSEQE